MSCTCNEYFFIGGVLNDPIYFQISLKCHSVHVSSFDIVYTCVYIDTTVSQYIQYKEFLYGKNNLESYIYRIMGLLSDVYYSPITCCLIVVLSAVHYRKSTFVDFNPMQVYFNYENIVNRKQYWRAVSSAFYHESLYHLIFNVLALWCFKFIEADLGSLFYLGYTLLFIEANRWIGILLGYFSNRIRGYLLSSIGFSDVIIAWSWYAALSDFKRVIYMLDIFPLSAYIVALVLLNVALLFTSVINRPSLIYIALFTGTSLGLGLNLLPTRFWVVTFLADVTMVTLWSFSAFPIDAQADDEEIESNVDQALEDALRLSREINFVNSSLLSGSGGSGWDRRHAPANSYLGGANSSLNHSGDNNV